MSTADNEIELIERIARLMLENAQLKAKIQQLIIDQDVTWIAATNGLSVEQVRKIREKVRDKEKGSEDED